MATTTITVRANPRDSFAQRPMYTLNLGTLGQGSASKPIVGIATDRCFHYLLSDTHDEGTIGAVLIKVDPATGAEVARDTAIGISSAANYDVYDIAIRRTGERLYLYALWNDGTNVQIYEFEQRSRTSFDWGTNRVITTSCKPTARHLAIKGDYLHVTSNYWFGVPTNNITHDVFRILDGDQVADQAFTVIGALPSITEAGVTFDGAFFIHKTIDMSGDPSTIAWRTNVNWIDRSFEVIFDSHSVLGSPWAANEKYSICYDGYQVLDFESQAS